jgi:hypothetical protein
MAETKYVKGYAIKNQWLNFSIYFTNFIYKTKNNPSNNNVCEWITLKDRLKDNNNPIGAKEINNKFLVNGSVTNTDFIEVNKQDLINFFEILDNQKDIINISYEEILDKVFKLKDKEKLIGKI